MKCVIMARYIGIMGLGGDAVLFERSYGGFSLSGYLEKKTTLTPQNPFVNDIEAIHPAVVNAAVGDGPRARLQRGSTIVNGASRYGSAVAVVPGADGAQLVVGPDVGAEGDLQVRYHVAGPVGSGSGGQCGGVGGFGSKLLLGLYRSFATQGGDVISMEMEVRSARRSHVYPQACVVLDMVLCAVFLLGCVMTVRFVGLYHLFLPVVSYFPRHAYCRFVRYSASFFARCPGIHCRCSCSSCWCCYIVCLG